ncbi:MAG: hypothetical protein Fur0012_06550 [Elusimicrobiota bacterium]
MGKKNLKKDRIQDKKPGISPFSAEKISRRGKILLFISFLFISAGFYGLTLLRTEVNSSFYCNLPVYSLLIGYILPVIALKA